jgi:hypothetical protein
LSTLTLPFVWLVTPPDWEPDEPMCGVNPKFIPSVNGDLLQVASLSSTELKGYR